MNPNKVEDDLFHHHRNHPHHHHHHHPHGRRAPPASSPENHLPAAAEAPDRPARREEAAAGAFPGEPVAEDEAAVAQAAVLVRAEEAQGVLQVGGRGHHRGRRLGGGAPAEDADGGDVRRPGHGAQQLSFGGQTPSHYHVKLSSF